VSKSIEARQYGDDYQAMVFWKYINDMLCTNSEISKIGYEYDEVKSFDDIVIFYNKPQLFGDIKIQKEYIQVKFHMTQDNFITLDNLLTPEFVNSNRYSFMDKVVKAYRENKENFMISKFTLYTTYQIKEDDKLNSLIDNVYRSFRISTLFDGKTFISEMGKIRKKYMDMLSLNEEELQEVLQHVSIYSEMEKIDELKTMLNREFFHHGLKSCPDSSYTNSYVDLIRNWSRHGKHLFTAQEVMDECKKEGLITKQEQNIAICNIPDEIDDLENRLENTLNLVPYFDQKHLKEEYSWISLNQKISEFVKSLKKADVMYQIELVTSYTVAFMAGRELYSKSGINVIPRQRTMNGIRLWDISERNIDYEEFQIEFESKKDSNNLVLIISATKNIYVDVKKYLEEISLSEASIYHFRMQKADRDSVKNGTHAWNLVKQINQYIEQEILPCKQWILHIFVSMPVAMMFQWGRLSHPYGKMQLYEYENFDNLKHTYFPTIMYPLK